MVIINFFIRIRMHISIIIHMYRLLAKFANLLKFAIHASSFRQVRMCMEIAEAPGINTVDIIGY